MTGTERLVELAEGRDLRLLRRMRSGFAVMHDTQFLPGYCLLLGYPESPHLLHLDRKHRNLFFDDMGILGEAVLQATECVRVNFSVYGNLDPFLHAHIVPRYEWEEPEHRTIPPLMYPQDIREHDAHRYERNRHFDLQEKISFCLDTVMQHYGLGSARDW